MLVLLAQRFQIHEENKLKVLITGAGGFIGSHLVNKCIEDGHYVIGLDKKPLDKWIVGRRKCDYRIPSTTVEEMEKFYIEFDLCFHLAAESRIQPSFRKPLEYVRSNVLGTSVVLEMATRQKARVVYAGSSTADDDPEKNVYAMSKWQGEELCKTWRKCFNADVGIARFYNVYGNRHITTGAYATVIGIWERQWVNCEPLTVTGLGTQKRDFTAVEDIVDGLAAIGERGSNGEFSLGTGENHALVDIAKMFVDYDEIEFIPRPPGESEVTLANISLNKEVLGWEAKRKLVDYIEEFKRIKPPRSQ